MGMVGGRYKVRELRLGGGKEKGQRWCKERTEANAQLLDDKAVAQNGKRHFPPEATKEHRRLEGGCQGGSGKGLPPSGVAEACLPELREGGLHSSLGELVQRSGDEGR